MTTTSHARPTVHRRVPSAAAAALALVSILGCGKDAVMPGATADAAGGADGQGQGDHGGGSADAPTDAGANCPVAAFTPHPPDVIFAFQRMFFTDAFGTTTRDEATKSAVLDTVMAYQDRIRFGFEDFPTVMEPCLGIATCCASEVLVMPAIGAYKAIDATILAEGSFGSHPPMAEALQAIREFYARSSDGVVDRFVVVTADRDPVCVDGMPECEAAAAEAKLLRDDGVTTAIVGVGERVAGSSCVDSVARSGGFARPGGTSFYQANNWNALETGLRGIVDDILTRACHVDLAIAPDDPRKVHLFFDGVSVPADPSHKNGWDYDSGSATTLTVYGAYCRELHDGLVTSFEVRSCG